MIQKFKNQITNILSYLKLITPDLSTFFFLAYVLLPLFGKALEPI